MQTETIAIIAVGFLVAAAAIIVALKSKGDVNLDGKVDQQDLDIVKKEIAKGKKKSKKKVSKKKTTTRKKTKKKASSKKAPTRKKKSEQ